MSSVVNVIGSVWYRQLFVRVVGVVVVVVVVVEVVEVVEVVVLVGRSSNT